MKHLGPKDDEFQEEHNTTLKVVVLTICKLPKTVSGKIAHVKSPLSTQEKRILTICAEAK
jgi:hypothetical protein